MPPDPTLEEGMEEFNRIIASDLSELEKLVRAFDWLTGRFVEQAQHDAELAQAMNDRETLVKAQIRLSVMQHAREMFTFCRQRVEAQAGGRP